MSSNHESIPLNDSTLPPERRVKINHSTAAAPRRRRKVGVKKGFGLHDWNRLLKTARDPAQRKGQPFRTITSEEISLHNDEYDAWISLHGKVYNITPYLHYHPGGVSILKQCFGKDASALFEKYHRWVNIHGLIGPLMIGELETINKSSKMKEKEFHFTTPAPRPPPRKPIPSLLGSSKSSLSQNDDDENDLNPWD